MTETLLSEDVETEPTIDPDKDYFSELVGEGRKFKDEKALARSKYESDLYIRTMERRMDELRSDYLKEREENTAKAKLQEMIDKLQSQQQSTSSYEPPVKEDKMPTPFDPGQLESLVSTKIHEHEISRKQSENFNIVKNKLKERFGNNYQANLKEQIESLGLTEEDVNALARKSPTAFMRSLGLDQPQQTESFQAPPRSSAGGNAFKPTGPAKRTWSFYQKMKKENPKQYVDSKTTIQMHNDAIELGEAFNDGDFYAV